ncbi:MAG TPA: DUF4340 domain-containing protein, partial [Verrucomicrobiae bacterium]
LENPQFRIEVTAGDQSWQINVGNRTAPGDGVYVRQVGGSGVFVVGVDWLKQLPHDVAAWRDTSLAGELAGVDHLVISNGTKAIELRRDSTNHLWRMSRPLTARVDGALITGLLQQLRTAHATRFVSDDPKADLSVFGLQTPELDISLDRGSNHVAVLHAGKEDPEHPGQIFVRRDGWNTVITTPKETLTPWRGDANSYRETHLVDFTAPIAEIELTGENHFILQRQGTNSWQVAGETFPVDMENLQFFVRMLANLRVTSFVKDVATATDLQGFGLAPTNARSLILRTIPGDTNAVMAALYLGATETNRVFVKLGDEKFVYALALEDVQQLPVAGWQFRDRRLWNFAETNLAQITIRQGGKTRQVLRTGPGKWSLAPGSQGIVDAVGLEETAKQYSSLTAAFWSERNYTLPEKFGFNTNNLALEFELKSGEKYAVNFGADLPSQNNPSAFASVMLDGVPWACVLPSPAWQLADAFLKITPGQP